MLSAGQLANCDLNKITNNANLRKFIKRLPGYGSLDYKSRLIRLHADSLEQRRLRYDLIYTYKVVFGLVNGAASDLFTLTSLIDSSGTYTRGHTYKLFPHCNRVDLYKYFFSQRIIDTWNSLPAKLNDFSSLARFTRFVRSAELSQFLSFGY